MSTRVVIYSNAICSYCAMAEQLLESKGVIEIEKIYVGFDPKLRKEMWTRTGSHCVPQIFIGETYVGSFGALYALDKDGELDLLLKES